MSDWIPVEGEIVRLRRHREGVDEGGIDVIVMEGELCRIMKITSDGSCGVRLRTLGKPAVEIPWAGTSGTAIRLSPLEQLALVAK